MIRKFSLIAAAALTLGACVETTETVVVVPPRHTPPPHHPAPKPVKPAKKVVPDDLYRVLRADHIAKALAKGCPRLRYRDNEADRVINSTIAALQARGYDRADLNGDKKNPPEARLRSDLTSYLRARNITQGDRNAYCAAGLKELQGKTLIGQFLAVKK